jgi:hypothetical protein
MSRIRQALEHPWGWFVLGAVATLSPPGAISVMTWMLAWDRLPLLLVAATSVTIGAAWWADHGTDRGRWWGWAVATWSAWIGFLVYSGSMLTPAGELSLLVAVISALTWFLAGGSLAVVVVAIARRRGATRARTHAEPAPLEP